MWKWSKRILLGLLAIILVSVTIVYAWSSMIMTQKFDSVERNVLLSSRPEILAEGQRLAQVYGCYKGCHGVDMRGEVFFEQFMIGSLVAPNLTRAVRDFSPKQLEAIIRQGVRPDGTGVMTMPSTSFAIMTDQDYSAIISFIRDYPEQEHDPGSSSYGLLARFFIVRGDFKPAPEELTGEPWKDALRREPDKAGEYLALTICSECHGPALDGDDGFAPSLVIAKAYDRAQFHRLMAEGIGIDERDLGLMKEVADKRFSHLKPVEMDALFDYLKDR